jgi:EF hand
MKTKLTVTLATLLGALTLAANAQDNNNDGPPPGGPGGFHHRPPPLPIVTALDTNHDGIIDSNEIANASAELLTLDKNGDGKLTPDEYLPPLPKDAPADAPRPPTPLIIKALDANGDGVIDANEIANAPAALRSLDKNGDGQLTRNEYLGPRPPRPGGHGGPNGQEGSDQGGPGQGPGGDDNNPPPGGDGDNMPPSGPPPSDN